MANLSLLVVLLVTALCVEGWTRKEHEKSKRDKVLRDILEDELLNWSNMEMEKEELLELELREASGDLGSGDSDDTDESGEAEESAEEEEEEGVGGAQIHFCEQF